MKVRFLFWNPLDFGAKVVVSRVYQGRFELLTNNFNIALCGQHLVWGAPVNSTIPNYASFFEPPFNLIRFAPSEDSQHIIQVTLKNLKLLKRSFNDFAFPRDR